MSTARRVLSAVPPALPTAFPTAPQPAPTPIVAPPQTRSASQERDHRNLQAVLQEQLGAAMEPADLTALLQVLVNATLTPLHEEIAALKATIAQQQTTIATMQQTTTTLSTALQSSASALSASGTGTKARSEAQLLAAKAAAASGAIYQLSCPPSEKGNQAWVYHTDKMKILKGSDQTAKHTILTQLITVVPPTADKKNDTNLNALFAAYGGQQMQLGQLIQLIAPQYGVACEKLGVATPATASA